jgi:hypothetical protein
MKQTRLTGLVARGKGSRLSATVGSYPIDDARLMLRRDDSNPPPNPQVLEARAPRLRHAVVSVPVFALRRTAGSRPGVAPAGDSAGAFARAAAARQPRAAGGGLRQPPTAEG